MTRARGFTLLELIVVLAIFGVLAIMAYGGLASVLKARERVSASLERTATLQKAYVRLRNDFQQLRARGARDGYGEPQPALLITPDKAVEFTRSGWRNPLSQPRSVLERVSYKLDADGRLLRDSWRVLDRAQDSQPSEAVVLDQVETVQWRFLPPLGNDWVDHWPAATGVQPSAGDVPPRAIELTLTLKDLGEVRLLFSAANDKPPKVPGAPPT